MDPVEIETQSSKLISFIIYTGSSEYLNISISKESSFDTLFPECCLNGFWIFSISDPPQYIELHFTQSISQTLYYRFDTSFLPPFIFLDINQTTNLVSFSHFYSFFSFALSHQKINFSFDTPNQLQSLLTFIQTFNLSNDLKSKNNCIVLSTIQYYTNNKFNKTKDYLFYSLIFISCQPWNWIFDYNESLSNALIDFISSFIVDCFYASKTEVRTPNFRNSIPFTFEPIQIKEKSIFPSLKFMSTNEFIDNFLSFIRVQLGEGFAFAVTSILLLNEDDTYASSLIYNTNISNQKYLEWLDNLLELLFRQANDDEDIESLYLFYISISTNKTRFSMKSKIMNLEKVANIISDRLLLTTPNFENDEEILTEFLNRIPNHQTIIQLLCNSEFFIPFEWIDSFVKVMNIHIPEMINFLTRNSLKHSISKHFLRYFANVTLSGSIFYNDLELTNRILQNESYKQKLFDCRKIAILLSQFPDLTGTMFFPNVYSSIENFIDPTCKIDQTAAITNGVSVGTNSIIEKNVEIGAGTQIGSNVFINEGVRIDMACLINDNEMIPHGVIVPIGFNYKQEAVEFSREIPKVIHKVNNTKFFFLQKSGFVDLNLCIKHGNLIFGYFEKFKLFPNECGRQLALNENLIQIKDEFIQKLYGLFNSYALIFTLSYLTYTSSNCFNNEMIKLAEMAIADVINKKSELLTVDDFLMDETRTEFLLFVANKLNVFAEKGMNSDQLISLKKFIFELTDEIIAKMSIFSNAQTKRTYQHLQEIIELTKDFNKLR